MQHLKDVAKKVGRAFDSQSLSNQHQLECERCNDTGTELTEQGARQCECVREKERQKRLARKAELIARIPPLYSGVTLAGLGPRPDLHPDQPRFIKLMQDHPFDNYYICGNNDTGKTHLLWALYENAVTAGRIVMASTLFDLLKQVKSTFKGNVEAPTGETGAWTIPRVPNLFTEQPCSVFFDDVDKARPTEFAAEFFFSLVDALYRYKHQVVVTSQLDPERRVAGRDSLLDHFERADPRYALGIVRRLVNDQTRIVRMF